MKFLRVIICLVVSGMQWAFGSAHEVSMTESLNLTSNSAYTSSESLQTMSGKDNEVECGIRGKAFPSLVKIVGGTKAFKHEFPWQARQETIWDMHVCGSVVIDRNWVLTAAHCLKDFQASEISFVAGDHDRIKEEGSEQRRKVKTIVLHPNYDPETNENDIALAKLVQPLKFDGVTVAPICLPLAGTNISGTCVVSGWGYTEQGGDLAIILRKVNVPIISDGDCQNNYRRKNKDISSHMLCAGYSSGGRDSCQADSGGPLACREPNHNRYYLGGVVSWGWGCANANFPGVYTEVSYFVDWIKEVMTLSE